MKSPPLFSAKEYNEWMSKKGYSPYSTPKKYPCIAVVNTVLGEEEADFCLSEEFIYLDDFKSYANLKIKRLEDFDEERCFTIDVNNEETETENTNWCFYVDSFAVGESYEFRALAANLCVNPYGKRKV